MKKTQTNTGLTQAEEGNTINLFRSRKWCFTLNNYEKYDIPMLINFFNTKNTRYIFGKEISESGTPHLQGFFETKNAISFNTLKKFNSRWHLEPAKGNILENYNYCSKDNDFYSNIYIEKPEIIEDFRPWQQEIFNIIKTTPNNRDIYWIYDSDGDKGKTSFCKWLFYHNHAFYCRGGKATDIKNILINNKTCRDIVIDLTRSNESFVSYTLMEELKDGFLFSTKYEGGMKLISTPHVFVFANFEPDLSKLSADRWKVFTINKNFELINTKIRFD